MSDENILDPMATTADDTQEEVIEEGNVDETSEVAEEVAGDDVATEEVVEDAEDEEVAE